MAPLPPLCCDDRRDPGPGEGGARLPKGADGFTLIELLVVVVVLGVLLAVSTPMLLGSRERAQLRAAHATARQAVSTARGVATATPDVDYAAAEPEAIQADEPGLKVQAPSSPALKPAEVSVAVAEDDQSFFAATATGNGECVFARDRIAGDQTGTTYAKAPPPDPEVGCTGDVAKALPEDVWSTSTLQP